MGLAAAPRRPGVQATTPIGGAPIDRGRRGFRMAIGAHSVSLTWRPKPRIRLTGGPVGSNGPSNFGTRGLSVTLSSALDLNRWHRWLYVAWFNFVVTYRNTTLGPFWLLAGPALFIVILGGLYSHVNGVEMDVFIPHLAVGIILWTLLGGFVTKSTTVYQRNRAQILQGSMTLIEITVVDVISIFLQFVHQLLIAVVVFVIYSHQLSLYAFVSLIGIAIVVANGIWLSIVCGIIGARYRDLHQVISAIMRVAFLATPIIWMATSSRGQALGIYLLLNPFYHFLEIVRAPLLGMPISTTSWIFVLTLTIGGFVLANQMLRRYARLVPLWV